MLSSVPLFAEISRTEVGILLFMVFMLWLDQRVLDHLYSWCSGRGTRVENAECSIRVVYRDRFCPLEGDLPPKRHPEGNTGGNHQMFIFWEIELDLALPHVLAHRSGGITHISI